MLEHIRVQFGVGQGSFHGGLIRTESKSMLWIYDFGTSSSDIEENLLCSLKRFCELNVHDSREIDTIFISHFDKDHVNGLQYLQSFKVNRFVIPDYNDVEKIILLSKLSTLEDPDNLHELIINPDQWIKERFGHDCEVLLATDEIKLDATDDHRSESDENQSPDNNKSFGQIDINWDEKGKRIQKPGIVKVNLGKSFIKFKFTPFWIKTRSEFIDVFEEYVIGILESSDIDLEFESLHQIMQCLQDQKKYEDAKPFLQEIQQCLFGDINIGSLCLSITYEYDDSVLDVFYLLRQGESNHYYPHYYQKHSGNQENLGWIGTGDSNFFKQEYFGEFFHAMKVYISKSVTMQVPHHGCKHNFNAFNVDKLPSVMNFIVSHGVNPSHYDHPWRMFKPLIEARFKRYIQVHNESDDLEEFIVFKEKNNRNVFDNF